MVTRYLDVKGKTITSSIAATHPPFERAIAPEMHDWELSAAKRGGQPIEASIWVSVIFNPKSAAAKGADATPRLLAVSEVFTHDRPTPAGQPPIVRMRVSIA